MRPGREARRAFAEALQARAGAPGADAKPDESGRWGGDEWLSQALVDGAFTLPDTGAVLNGALDLVLRVNGMYYIADYKTNHAAGSPEVPAYSPGSLAAIMAESHYHLQALIYTVALHRLLRQRLGRAYDYDRHVGGHLYLFLRGLGAAVGGGVFRDRWPRAVVERLDAALSAGGDHA